MLPLRHPLKELVVVVENLNEIGTDAINQVRPYIYEELNVKDLKITGERSEYGIEMKAKPNFPVLAVKAKEKMKTLGGKIEAMSEKDVSELRRSGKFVLDEYELVLEDIKILPKLDTAKFSQYEADFDENVIVLLDVTPDEEMVNEGVLRDILNRIQRLRKEYKLVPTDAIEVYYQVTPSTSKLSTLVNKSVDYLKSNIKKPFKPYDKSLTLTVSSKSFDVTFSFIYFQRFVKRNFNILLYNFLKFIDGKLEVWVQKLTKEN